MAESVLRLLLPGTLCDGRVFAPMCDRWPAGKPVRMADLHGLGPAVDWWMGQLPGLPKQFDVLGFSLGGILAMTLLSLAPARVRRLVLVASNPQAGTPAHAQRALQQRQMWLEQGPRALALDLMRQTTAPARQSTQMQHALQAMAETTPLAAFDAQARLNATRPDGGTALAAWPGPLMLISGAADPWCGADKQALLLKSRPDAIWHELPEAGHYLPLERPADLARLTEEFLN